MKRRILLWIGLLAGTFAFIYWWENALVSIPLSETVWTFYFHLTGQTNPGLASDLEFLTTIGIGLLLSYGFTFVLWRCKVSYAFEKDMA